MIVVCEVGEVIGEIAEVVAEAKPEVVAEVVGNRGQCTENENFCFGRIEGTSFKQHAPVVQNLDVGADDAEMVGITE